MIDYLLGYVTGGSHPLSTRIFLYLLYLFYSAICCLMQFFCTIDIPVSASWLVFGFMCT